LSDCAKNFSLRKSCDTRLCGRVRIGEREDFNKKDAARFLQLGDGSQVANVFNLLTSWASVQPGDDSDAANVSKI
jgi:hypothetical protein